MRHDRKAPKRPRDPNQLAKSIVKEATGIAEADTQKVSPQVESGSIGGHIGGAARAKSLTPEQRSEIGRITALTRWKRS